MKSNVNNKKKKVRLLRDVFSYPLNKSSEKIEKDEMIVHERNKITYAGFTGLTGVIILFGVFADTFDWEQMISLPILALVGLVKYIMLIAFCKKRYSKTCRILERSYFWCSHTTYIFGLSCSRPFHKK